MAARMIERIVRPDDETLLGDYVAKQRPVIITNLFAGQPIQDVDSLPAARKAFGRVKLLVQQEYTAAAASTGETSFVTMTFDEYWDLVGKQSTTQMCCTEYEIPARVMELFKLPSLCLGRDLDAPELLSLPRKYGDHDLLANLFVANQGNKAHLHYDGDHRQVLLHQVFGRKEVILFPTRSGLDLKPLDLGTNFSGCYLENLTRSQKLEQVERADGYYGMLHPGETVYIPMLMWHYLEYVDHAMSFNMRFGRSRYGRFLCADNFHRDHYIQNFASTLVGDALQTPKYLDAITAIVSEYTQPVSGMPERVKRMRALFKALCMELCPEHRAHEYCPAEWESRELDRILRDISKKVVYGDVETIRKMRPAGPISSTQARHIQDNATRLGYSAALLQRLMQNRLGKSQAAALSSAEAATFLLYMRSPGALW